jgi:hypothetical protein
VTGIASGTRNVAAMLAGLAALVVALTFYAVADGELDADDAGLWVVGHLTAACVGASARALVDRLVDPGRYPDRRDP